MESFFNENGERLLESQNINAETNRALLVNNSLVWVYL